MQLTRKKLADTKATRDDALKNNFCCNISGGDDEIGVGECWGYKGYKFYIDAIEVCSRQQERQQGKNERGKKCITT